MPSSLIGIALLAGLSLASLGLALGWGSVPLSLADWWQGCLQPNSASGAIVWQLRLPRALAAFACGGLLALAGTLMQLLLRNPLADPAILGVSGGAACCALLAISLGVAAPWLPLWALAGALLAMVLVLSLARLYTHWDSTRLLLTGVVLAAGWGAAINALLVFSQGNSLHSMLFWLMGDLSDARQPLTALLGLLVAFLIAFALAPRMNLLLRGEQAAEVLGVAVPPLRWLLLIVASLCTAMAVTQGGALSFIGLIAPHSLRKWGWTDHRYLLPGAVLLGASLLTLADTLARCLWAPLQLPVGILTALLGVPLLLFLLRQETQAK